MRLIERRKKGVFIQPTVGISTNVFDAGFTSRLVWVNLDQAGNSSSGVFIEPVVTTKLRFKNIKAIAQLGLSYPMNEERMDFTYQPFMFSIGLQAKLNVLSR